VCRLAGGVLDEIREAPPWSAPSESFTASLFVTTFPTQRRKAMRVAGVRVHLEELMCAAGLSCKRCGPASVPVRLGRPDGRKWRPGPTPTTSHMRYVARNQIWRWPGRSRCGAITCRLTRTSADDRGMQSACGGLAPRIGTTEPELVKTGRLRCVQSAMSDIFKTAAFDRSATPPSQETPINIGPSALRENLAGPV
jgi:hypothetical protein